MHALFCHYSQEEAQPDPAAAGPPGEGGAEGEAPPIAHTGSTMACHPWLSSMINYAQPIKFQSFEAAESKLDMIKSAISGMRFGSMLYEGG